MVGAPSYATPPYFDNQHFAANWERERVTMHSMLV